MALKVIFEKLLDLPLFQGISRSDFEQIISHTRLGFSKVSRNNAVAIENDPCDRLHILMSGTIRAESHADDGIYLLTEWMTAPGIIQPECLFGLMPRFTKSFVAEDTCQIMSIEKQEVLKLFEQQEIFRLNFLNLISTRSQRISRLPWRQRPDDIRSKIARFVEERSLRPAGRKRLRITMEDLGHLLAESRLNVSRELNRMNREGLIILHRSSFDIPVLERLLIPTT